MRNTITYTLASIMILASMLLVGCDGTLEPDSIQEPPEARAALTSFAEAAVTADEQKLAELFCPSMSTDEFIELMNTVGLPGRKAFQGSLSSAIFIAELSKKDEIWYRSPIESTFTQSNEVEWMKFFLKKQTSGWCIEFYTERPNETGGKESELQRKMREVREQ